MHAMWLVPDGSWVDLAAGHVWMGLSASVKIVLPPFHVIFDNQTISIFIEFIEKVLIFR
jgi:hypothetical protein